MIRMEVLKKLAECNIAILSVNAWSLRSVCRKMLAILLLLIPLASHAGFLEMPDTTETPEFERQSLLLDMDIPTVKDRDPNPQAGPRLNVKEFRVQGLREYPELGITRDQIIKQVEALRFDMMGEGKLLGSSGYTVDELSKVSDLIADIEKETQDQHVGPLEVQKLVFLIREQHRQRGITLGMIETVADTITRYYREHGFILAKAYIPKQQVRDGVVTLTVLLGELGEVDVQNNKRYSANTIKNVFKRNLGKPVTNELVEENLYLLNDFPGLSVQGYFEPGAQVGDTKLNINVTSEPWYSANVRLDNHGSENSGQYRAYSNFSLHNPLRIGDEIELGVLGSFAPQNSTYGSFRYSVPVLSPRVKFSLGVSSNDFVIGDGNSETNSTAGLDLNGNSVVTDASIKYQFKRSRVKNYAVELKASQIESEINTGSSNILTNTLQNVELSYDFDVLNEKSRVLHQGNLNLIASHMTEGADGTKKTSPFIVTLDYSRLSFITVPFTQTETKMVLRASAQYAGTLLASTNQYTLAGPTRARGFQVNEYYGDDAISLGVDWIFKGLSFNGASFGGEHLENIVQPFLFADYGYGQTHAFLKDEASSSSEDDESTSAQLVNAGFGFKLSYKESMRGSLNFAFPLASKTTGLEGKKPGDGMNIYFDMQFGF